MILVYLLKNAEFTFFQICSLNPGRYYKCLADNAFLLETKTFILVMYGSNPVLALASASNSAPLWPQEIRPALRRMLYFFKGYPSFHVLSCIDPAF